MKQKKIYPQEWLELHPYKQSSPVDTYYANIANDVYGSLLFLGITETLIDDQDARDISCCLAAYLEDVVSQTGIWRAFLTECRKLYGKPLPFYQEGKEYFDDEINYEDICFLMWHYLQQKQKKSFFNPDNEGIRLIADDVYSLFEDEYEVAPENEKMQAFLSPEKDYSDFAEYRKLLSWFHYSAFPNVFNMEEVSEAMETMIKKGQNIETLEYYRYSILDELMFKKNSAWLGYTSPEWLARIIGPNHPAYPLFSELKWRNISHYNIIKEEKDSYLISDVATGEEFYIEKKSLADNLRITPGKSVLVTSIVRYNNKWWQSGGIFVLQTTDLKDDDYIDKQAEQQKNARASYEAFIKGSKGEKLVFLSSNEDLFNFFTNEMDYTIGKDFKLPGKNGRVILTATPDGGIAIMQHGMEAIKSPHNPLYNKAKASKDALNFFLIRGFCPAEIVYYLEENGMLPDAQVKSLISEERGKEIVHDNYDFLIRYFLGAKK